MCPGERLQFLRMITLGLFRAYCLCKISCCLQTRNDLNRHIFENKLIDISKKGVRLNNPNFPWTNVPGQLTFLRFRRTRGH